MQFAGGPVSSSPIPTSSNSRAAIAVARTRATAIYKKPKRTVDMLSGSRQRSKDGNSRIGEREPHDSALKQPRMRRLTAQNRSHAVGGFVGSGACHVRSLLWRHPILEISYSRGGPWTSSERPLTHWTARWPLDLFGATLVTYYQPQFYTDSYKYFKVASLNPLAAYAFF